MDADIQKLVEERFKLSFETELGAKFKSYSEGFCEIELEVEERHLNIGRSVHGGVINALCDIALSGAVTCLDVDGPRVVTMQMNVNFLRPGKLGDTLTAYGEVIKGGRKVAYVEGGIKNQKGDLLARASGDWYIKSS